MADMLLGISPEFLYFHKKPPKKVSDLHRPYFLAFCPKDKTIENARKELLRKWEAKTSEEDTLFKIEEIGEIENYRSFWDVKRDKRVFKV